MELVLYQYWRSSASYRVRLALALKGIAHESRAVNLLRDEQLGDAHRTRVPIGQVPCLLVDGRPLGESVAILEWLKETFPATPLLPKDPWARARVRQLVEIVNSGTQPMQNLSVVKKVSSEATVQAAWARSFIERGMRAFEAVLAQLEADGLGQGPFCVGGTVSLADVVVVPQVGAARRFGADIDGCTRLLRAHDATVALPGAAAAAPEAQADAPKV